MGGHEGCEFQVRKACNVVDVNVLYVSGFLGYVAAGKGSTIVTPGGC